jgi:hypothetical protein
MMRVIFSNLDCKNYLMPTMRVGRQPVWLKGIGYIVVPRAQTDLDHMPMKRMVLSLEVDVVLTVGAELIDRTHAQGTRERNSAFVGL